MCLDEVIWEKEGFKIISRSDIKEFFKMDHHEPRINPSYFMLS